ncbi:hypothetical protein JRQ81_012806 [Phrynocephalus forsythii]|uniref:Uncharacterized protein n=1 Tax=Phrynocephalus forsythii TaxID=171643 RepID=A0A9Q1B5B5_9SAUR|nr:hypothetical protein JRQ81_012806 [Phrynocephalus forsythii]
MSLTDYETIVARHVANVAAKQIAMAICFHCHAWLHTATITDNARSRIEDSPFDGEGLLMFKTTRSYSYQGTSNQPTSHQQSLASSLFYSITTCANPTNSPTLLP